MNDFLKEVWINLFYVFGWSQCYNKGQSVFHIKEFLENTSTYEIFS